MNVDNIINFSVPSLSDQVRVPIILRLFSSEKLK